MAKFDAATAVEELEYDFTKYGGGKGVIPEPTTGAVNEFFSGMRVLVQDARGIEAPDPDGEMDAEEMAEALDGMDDTMVKAQEFQQRSIELLSLLCQGSPSAEDLARLPLRVTREFSKWLVRQINPKDQTEATVTPMPRPQDRRRGTRRSSKARG